MINIRNHDMNGDISGRNNNDNNDNFYDNLNNFEMVPFILNVVFS